MCKAESYVTTMIDMLKDIKESYEFNILNIEDTEKSLTDLGHQIELSTFNAVEGYKLAKEEQNLRRDRRRMKDENVTLKFLYDYFSDDKFNSMVTDLQKLRGDIKREHGKLGTRLYTPKIRTDLTIAIRAKVTEIQAKYKQAGGM